jgi:type I restriction enzyme S subunit
MKGWHYQRIGGFSEIGSGSSPRPIIDQAYFIDGKIPWIKIADATASFKYIYKTKEYVNEYGASFSRKLPPGALILAASGTLGFPIFLGIEGCIHDGWLYFKSINKNVDRQYLYYCLITFIKSFNSISYGAAIQNINTDILRNTEIPLPPPPIQRKIAAVLSAYDDLIENNNRRIAILEKMAEELYREWFVRLRFPGHEKTKIVKGVPEGWEVVELNKIADEVSKSTKPGIHLENRYYLPIDLLQQKHFNPESHLSYEEAQSSLVTFQKGDILFGAMRPYLHKVCIAPFDGITRTTCFVIRSLDHYFYSYLYLLLFQNSSIEYANNICNGADRPYVVWNKSFERMFVFKPHETIVEKFDSIVYPLIQKVSESYFLLQTLRTSRERLLSRLMSGKIDVENLDIQFPDSMKEEAAANA